MVYCGVGGTVNETSGLCISDTSYEKTDFQNIVVDGLGTTGAAFVSWVDLIVLLIVLGFVIGIFLKLGNLFK
jgi:hypothetical protein